MYKILHDIGLVKFVTVLHPLNHKLEEFNIQADISFCIIFCAFSEQRINEFNENWMGFMVFNVTLNNKNWNSTNNNTFIVYAITFLCRHPIQWSI